MVGLTVGCCDGADPNLFRMEASAAFPCGFLSCRGGCGGGGNLPSPPPSDSKTPTERWEMDEEEEEEEGGGWSLWRGGGHHILQRESCSVRKGVMRFGAISLLLLQLLPGFG